MATPEPIISVRNLVNRFGRQVVHDGLDLDVMPGEVLGIVGGSGSGKSVLVHTMLGLRRPTAGEVLFEGKDISQMDEAELRNVKRRYGVTFQHGALFSALNVTANVQMPLREYLDLPNVVLDQIAMLRIRMVGLAPDAAGKLPSQLSGGMIKRAALARALALDPTLLFLDEPTAGLDFPSRVQLWEILRQRCSDGLTIVLTTQDLSEAEDMATDGLILRSGEIAARGTVEQLRTRAGSANMQLTFANASAASAAVALIGATDATLDTTGRQVSVMTGNTLADSNAILERLEQLAEPPLEISIGPPPLSELIMRLGDNAQVGATHA